MDDRIGEIVGTACVVIWAVLMIGWLVGAVATGSDTCRASHDDSSVYECG